MWAVFVQSRFLNVSVWNQTLVVVVLRDLSGFVWIRTLLCCVQRGIDDRDAGRLGWIVNPSESAIGIGVINSFTEAFIVETTFRFCPRPYTTILCLSFVVFPNGIYGSICSIIVLLFGGLEMAIGVYNLRVWRGYLGGEIGMVGVASAFSGVANPRSGFGSTKSEVQGTKLVSLDKLCLTSSPSLFFGAAVFLVELGIGEKPGGRLVLAGFAGWLQLESS